LLDAVLLGKLPGAFALQSDERIVGSRKSGDASEVRETKFTVKQSGQSRWVVYETGFEKPLAEFDQRDDAIGYARGLAATKARASVDADGDNGSAPLHESYALDPSTNKSL
jgi:hypothetical protein